MSMHNYDHIDMSMFKDCVDVPRITLQNMIPHPL